MWRREKRHYGRWERLGQLAFTSRWASVLVAGAIIVTACGGDHPTSPSAMQADAGSTRSVLGDTSSPPGGATSQSAKPAGVAQTAATPGTPANFRLESRTGSQLRLNWEWGSGVTRYELAYAGRTVVLNQYYPGTTQDVSNLDLSPGHTYTFSLRAFDGAGNASAPAELAFETTPPQPPSNLQQVNTKRIKNSSGRVDEYPDVISFTPGTDNAGPIRVYEALLDGVSFGRFSGGQTTQFSLFQLVSEFYGSIPCGPTTLQVRAYDSSLNAGPLSAALTVMFPAYDNCPPPHGDN
jgi:hypothetical protein